MLGKSSRPRKKQSATESSTGTLKRKRKAAEDTPSKKRRMKDGTAKAAENGTDAPLLSPVAWRPRNPPVGIPVLEKPPPPFTLLKDWREQFPEPDSGSESGDKESTVGQVQIDASALQAALRANLSSLTGGAGAGELGLDESMLLEHITRMLASDGATADDIAGSLADALFARDGDEEGSAAGTEEQEEMDTANEGGAPGLRGEPSPPAESADGSQPSRGKQQVPAFLMPDTPANRRPPTPSSSSTSTTNSGSQRTPQSHRPKHPLSRVDSQQQQQPEPDVGSILAAAGMGAPRSRKRKQPQEHEVDGADAGAEEQAKPAPKRVAMRSFDAPTASSKARTASTAQANANGKKRAGK